MRKIRILFLFTLLCALLPLTAVCAAQRADAPVDWDWLVDQVASGAQSITLPGDIHYEGDVGLATSDTVRIDGGGFTLTGAIIDEGTFIFRDVRLLGTHGVGNESGGDALILRGDGAIAVLMGSTRAEGGRSGRDGESGGDGIQLLGDGQGLILNENATATGGVGRLYGGAGVRVAGCGSNILVTDNAALIGSMGLVEGGAGLSVPACCKVTVEVQGSVTGGGAQYAAGSGIHSHLCDLCADGAPIVLSGMSMSIGSAGQTGGNGIDIARRTPGEVADLTLGGDCMVIGGDGDTNGAAIRAERVRIQYAGQPKVFGGRYFATEAPALQYAQCEEEGADSLLVTEGTATKTYPASDIASMINNALAHRSTRYTPTVIEDGLNVRATETKLEGFTVDRGKVSQVKVSGNGLKIFMYTGTLEKRMQFQQRLMSDGEAGVRLVLIGATSDEWPTMESTAAALRKLQSIGVTQIAYTCAAPAYHERVLDIETLVKAIEAYEAAEEAEVPKILCGTADDAVIFVLADGTRDYQEQLMGEVIRPSI